jgi:hypothetical protein
LHIQLYLAINDHMRADYHTRSFTASNLPYSRAAMNNIIEIFTSLPYIFTRRFPQATYLTLIDKSLIVCRW